MSRNRRGVIIGALLGAALLAAVAIAGTWWVMDDADADEFSGECARITYDGRSYYSVGRPVSRDDLVTPDDPLNAGEGPRSCDPGAMETLEFRPAGVRHIPGVDPTEAVVARYDLTDGREALYVADRDYARTGELPDDLAEALGSS
ncbi:MULTISPECIES: hypothetical protein [Mumia]|uniref:hypothetical protein n=1 Tax=Mumia TaxID=1546255 RepID=UPI00141EF990|nr:hypothetical protein [Mumia sp. ZJ1417]QMW66008.1 hypothetical protein H4N58_17960 [Mumia sp. ZJ1417]